MRVENHHNVQSRRLATTATATNRVICCRQAPPAVADAPPAYADKEALKRAVKEHTEILLNLALHALRYWKKLAMTMLAQSAPQGSAGSRRSAA